MKKLALLSAFVVVFFVASPMHAQGDIGGCVDSPENPTALLAVVGGAGAFLTVVRNRFRK